MANAAAVDARRALQPETGARWIEVAGARAMFDGVDSPISQTFGIGLFDPFLTDEFDQVEAFFAERGARVHHEICSFADRATISLLSARGYSPVEASVVLIRPTVTVGDTGPSTISVRTIGEDEATAWCRLAAQGWSDDSPELKASIEELLAIVVRARDVTAFVAEQDGEAIATGALNLVNGVAVLAGASTIPVARRQGAQRALLHARLAFAAARGADLAMVVAQPGSGSQRNAEREGFRPVYARVKWGRAAGHSHGSTPTTLPT